MVCEGADARDLFGSGPTKWRGVAVREGADARDLFGSGPTKKTGIGACHDLDPAIIRHICSVYCFCPEEPAVFENESNLEI